MNHRSDKIRISHERRQFYKALKEPIDHKSAIMYISKELNLDEKKVQATIDGIFSHNIGIGFFIKHFKEVSIPRLGKFVIGLKGSHLVKRFKKYYNLNVNKRKGEYKPIKQYKK